MNLTSTPPASALVNRPTVDQGSTAPTKTDAARQTAGLEADAFEGTSSSRVGVDGTRSKVSAPPADGGQGTRAPRVRAGLSPTGSTVTGTAGTTGGVDPANPLARALATILGQMAAAANANQNPGG